MPAIDRVCRQGNGFYNAIGNSGGHQRSRCIQQHHIAPARSFALQNRENDRRILPGIAPANWSSVARCKPISSIATSYTRTLPSRTSASLAWSRDRDLVQAIMPHAPPARAASQVRSARGASFSTSFQLNTHAHHPRRGPRRIRQRPQQIEDRAQTQFATHRLNVFHRGMHRRRVQKSNSGLFQAGGDASGGQIRQSSPPAPPSRPPNRTWN